MKGGREEGQKREGEQDIGGCNSDEDGITTTGVSKGEKQGREGLVAVSLLQ